MNRIALTLITVAGLALAACSDGTSDQLSNGQSGAGGGDPNGTAGGESTTFDHSNDPGGAAPGADFQPPEPAQVRLIGSPEISARLHACGKLTVASLGTILASRGLTGVGTRPAGAQAY